MPGRYHRLKTLSLGLLALACASSALAQTDTGANGATVVVKGDLKPRKTGDWVRAESPHFIVYSDRAQKDVSALLSKLERFDYVLRLYSGIKPAQIQTRLELYYLASDQKIDKVSPGGPEYTIGLYRACAEGTQAYGVHMYYDPKATGTLDKQPENEGLIYIFQAYARHFFYQHSPQRVPVWFIEGYAEFFSTARFEDNQAIVGMAAVNRARQLNLLGNGMRYKLDYKDIVLQNEREGIFDPRKYDVVSEYSSKSWLLTHYILSSKTNLTKFRSYLSLVRGGAKPEAAFEQAFGFKIGKLDGELDSYMRRNLFAVTMVFKDMPDDNISIQALPEGVENLLMAGSALKTCPDAVRGADLLQTVRNETAKLPAKTRDSDLVRLIAARAEIEFGSLDTARTLLEAVLKSSPENPEAFYLKGMLHMAEAKTADAISRDGPLNRAQVAFLDAGSNDPSSALAAFGYYRAQMRSPDKIYNMALAGGLMAWQLSPWTDVYTLHAGLIYGYLGRTDEALETLRPLAEDPLAGPLAVTASDWVKRLEKGVSHDEIGAVLVNGLPVTQAARLQWTYAASDVLVDLRAKADLELNGDLPPVEPPQ